MLHSLVKYWLFALPIPFLWADLATSSKVFEASGLLSFEEASVLTLTRSPRLESSRWNVRIKEASAIGAAALPNPELTLDVENAFGSSEFRDLDAAEKTLSLGQRIETAGKRRKRIDLANQGIEVANLEQGIEQFRVLNAMAKS
jgi:cobalt-zinc-cadmium efflux system outer membrane protein